VFLARDGECNSLNQGPLSANQNIGFAVRCAPADNNALF